ncbi:hypothetical protein VN1204_07680 [Helicobacter pylori]|nr:hypothetical protein VN1204_07680 [Helicobacter pylori]
MLVEKEKQLEERGIQLEIKEKSEVQGREFFTQERESFKREKETYERRISSSKRTSRNLLWLPNTKKINLELNMMT